AFQRVGHGPDGLPHRIRPDALQAPHDRGALEIGGQEHELLALAKEGELAHGTMLLRLFSSLLRVAIVSWNGVVRFFADITIQITLPIPAASMKPPKPPSTAGRLDSGIASEKA